MAASRTSRSKIPIVVAIVVGLVLVAAVRIITAGGGGAGNPGSAAGPASGGQGGGCVGLAVTASSEKAALLSAIATSYNAEAGKRAARCARVTVTSKASGGAEEALAHGWDDATDGPRPDVWTPASSSWTAILRQALAQQDKAQIVPDGAVTGLARTPLVLAMPRPMADALGWPDKPIGWGDLLTLARDPAGWGRLGHPEWGRFKLGKTNPDFSTSGLHATVGAFVAATGRSSDLTAADLADPAVLGYIAGVESSVVHYGDTTLTFLANLQAADDRGQGLTYISAVAVEEKSVWDYNQGNPTGDPATLGKHTKPRTPLVAVYPSEGTLLSDNPYLVLAAPWVDDAKRGAAADFLSYVQSAPAQSRFTGAAFRDFEGKPGPRITRAEGLLAEQPKVVLSPPSPPVLSAVRASFAQLRKRAQVLLVIDVSGSMSDDVGSAGSTKLELAKRAALRAVDQFAPDDQLGLWIFSTDLDRPRPYRELIPIGPVRDDLAAVKAKIGALTPGGGTALYATMRAARQSLAQRFDPTRINAVVLLTDGRNEYPADTDLDGLVRSLQGESDDTAVRIFPIGYGGDVDLPVLRRIAQASGGAAYDASDPRSIDNVFTAVISNF